MNRPAIRLCAVLTTTAALTVTCISPNLGPRGEYVTESQSVPVGQAKSVQVEVDMQAGEIKIGGGAQELLEAEFAYDQSCLKPEIKYDVTGTRGQLTVRQREATGTPFGPNPNKWSLRLNNSIPMELKAHLGAGKSELLLGTLSLTRLDVHLGVGEVIVDLAGDWQNDLVAKIHDGVGKATLRLPRDVGVLVRARGGIGQIHAREFTRQGENYVNEAYGKSRVNLRVEVEGGVGEINLELGEGPAAV